MDDEIDELLNQVFGRAKLQFGDAVETDWFYAEERCPGCGKDVDDEARRQKDHTLSLNAFLYRPHGVLIGYFLCGTCGGKVVEAKQKALLHTTIENTLSNAYLADLP